MAINGNIRSRILIITIVIAALMSSIIIPVWADFSVDEWRLFKSISLPIGDEQEFLVEIVPDSEIFANTLPKLSDVRIIEEENQHEIQYKLLVEHGDERRKSTEVTIRDLAHSPDFHSKFVVDLGEEKFLHNELEIIISSQNFQRSVVVEGSTDGKNWAVLEEAGPIFDFSIKDRNFTTRDTSIRYPDSTARYLQVHIINGKEPPLEITGAVAYFSHQSPPNETEHSATMVSPKKDSEEKKTLIVLDMGNSGIPTNRLTIATSQQNFYRQVDLNGSNDAKSWVTVQKSEILYDYNTSNFVRNDLSINYPESTFRYFQIVIHNEDNPPLQIDNVRPYGFLRKFIFPARQDGIYRLYYGNETAHTPSYELERIFPYLVTQNLPKAELGNQSENHLYTIPTLSQRPFTERYPWLLPLVVLVAAFLIGLFLANLLRKIKKIIPPPS